MPILGAHLSVSEGYSEMFFAADRIGCEAIQIFAKNQRQWESKPLEKSVCENFKKSLFESKVKYIGIHASYLLNLASLDETIFNKSISSLIDDLKRGERLGIDDIVLHPGSHLGIGESLGVRRIVEAINIIFKETESGNVLLETTSGQGTSVGWRFEHLRDIISAVKSNKRLFVCYDTCHTFAAGYDIRTKSSYEETMNAFDRIIGIKRLKLFHLNDSKNEFNTRKDRHEFIGKGFIGQDAFAYLMNDKRFKDIPMILEVPGNYEDFEKEIVVLKRLINN
ncbi:MAG: deoxyribonuclease IV [bacterium]